MRRVTPWLVLAVTLNAVPALSQVPQTMSYQGVLLDNAGGIPPDATHSFTFTIYDHLTLGTPGTVGGHSLWTETQSRLLSRGGFDALLGSITPLALPFNQPYYLGIQVDGGTELTPRTPLASSPYSLSGATSGLTGSGTANRVAKFTGASTLGNSVITETPAGNVGVGTTAPLSTLDVAGGIRGFSAALNGVTGSTTTGYGTVGLSSGAGWGGLFQYGSDGNNAVYLGANGTAAAFYGKVTMSTRLGIATNTPTQALDVNGVIVERAPNSYGLCNSEAVVWDPTTKELGIGIVCAPTMADVAPISNAADVLSLRPVQFLSGDNGAVDVGLVPEVVNRSVRELVKLDRDGKPTGIKYEKLSLYLLEIVKQQAKDIAALKADVDRLAHR